MSCAPFIHRPEAPAFLINNLTSLISLQTASSYGVQSCPPCWPFIVALSGEKPGAAMPSVGAKVPVSRAAREAEPGSMRPKMVSLGNGEESSISSSCCSVGCSRITTLVSWSRSIGSGCEQTHFTWPTSWDLDLGQIDADAAFVCVGYAILLAVEIVRLVRWWLRCCSVMSTRRREETL